MRTNITQILDECRDRQPQAMKRLFPIVYQELRRIAHRQLQNMWSIETICTTALVNEAYLKLVKQQNCSAQNRAHFFAIAATAMRQILINYVEHKQTQKRGGDWQRVGYEELCCKDEQPLEVLLLVNEALEEVKLIDAELARLVELKFFAGMTETEIADVYQVNERTVRRNWRKAKALLVQTFEAA